MVVVPLSIFLLQYLLFNILLLFSYSSDSHHFGLAFNSICICITVISNYLFCVVDLLSSFFVMPCSITNLQLIKIHGIYAYCSFSIMNSVIS